MCFSETQCFAPNGARNWISQLSAYKHLAPNGAKATTSITSDRFVARTLETVLEGKNDQYHRHDYVGAGNQHRFPCAEGGGTVG